MQDINDIGAALLGVSLSRDEADKLIASINSRVAASPASKADLDAVREDAANRLTSFANDMAAMLDAERDPNAGNGFGAIVSHRLDRIEAKLTDLVLREEQRRAEGKALAKRVADAVPVKWEDVAGKPVLTDPVEGEE